MKKVSKSIEFYIALARGPLFHCRVAQVGGTKYRNTHGSREGHRPGTFQGPSANTVRTPVAKCYLGNPCLGN